MVKRFVFVILMSLVLLAGSCWAQRYTIDDVMKEAQGIKQDVKQLQIGQAKLEGRFDGLEKRFDDMRGTLNLLGSILAMITALVVGTFGFVVYIARNLRPAAEKEKKIMQIIDAIVEHIQGIDEKLQLPKILKPIL